MKKLSLFAAVAALVLAFMGTNAASARIQELDPAMIDGITEAINKRDPEGVLAHFAPGGTVIFDNSAFKVPNEVITAAEYVSRFQPGNPDVPADVLIEVAPNSVRISGDRASWKWRQTAGFLRDMGIDYIESTVVATIEELKFKSLTIAPTPESLAKVPYSPSPIMGVVPSPGMPRTGSGVASEITLLGLTLVALGMLLTGARIARTHTLS